MTKSYFILLKLSPPKKEKDGNEVACQEREEAHKWEPVLEEISSSTEGKNSLDSSEYLFLLSF